MLSHLGICVSDLPRSVRFYCEALGFTEAESITVGDEFGPLMEVDDVNLETRYVTRDGVRIELLHFHSPGHRGDGGRRPMNQLGLTHLSFRVADIDAVAADVERLGGFIVAQTRTTFGADLDFVYCTDPDGTRIELMVLPA